MFRRGGGAKYQHHTPFYSVLETHICSVFILYVHVPNGTKRCVHFQVFGAGEAQISDVQYNTLAQFLFSHNMFMYLL